VLRHVSGCGEGQVPKNSDWSRVKSGALAGMAKAIS
jgi:hypothetical protein